MSCDPNAKAPVVQNPSGLIDGNPIDPKIIDNILPDLKNPIETYRILDTKVPQ
jgi:hypothetical protein